MQASPVARQRKFQSTGPLRDPTRGYRILINCDRISIHRSLAGPDSFGLFGPAFTIISIHRSLAGPDDYDMWNDTCTSISIHRSLAGPDMRKIRYLYCLTNFNPQVPCGTRRYVPRAYSGRGNFNPQVPCGTRRWRSATAEASARYFNPQVPCGTRLLPAISRSLTHPFQSTGPLRDPTAGKPILLSK